MPLTDEIDDEEVRDVEDGLGDFNGDVLDVSDDELADLTTDQLAELATKAEATPKKEEAKATEEEGTPAATGEPSSEDTGEEGTSLSGDEEKKDGDTEAKEETKEAKAEDAVSEDLEGAGDKPAAAKEEDPAKTESAKKTAAKPAGEINYKQEYEKLLAPFKANGRQIQVDSVDDALTLMKMGANYNKKMAALKPSLKLVKMLEQNDLLDEEKLSHLIDLSLHKSGAVAKLMKDAKIDPLDIDAENVDYTPGAHVVNDSQFELDQVIDDIKDNESFPKTIDTISNQWDSQSKDIVLKDPKIITVIDEHVQSGIFDKIVSVMERERMLGRLEGIPDIVAYKEIGELLTKEGKLGKTTTPAPQAVVEEPEADPEADKAREEKRNAAASTKSTTKTSNTADFNPLDMPDDEFEKLSVNGLYR